MTSIEVLFEQNQLYHVFQPICYLNCEKKLGYEALIRSRSGINPDQLFRQAMKSKQLFDLDTQSILKAITSYFGSKADQNERYLFVNIFPSTLASKAFPPFIDTVTERFHAYTGRIVFEINESVFEWTAWDDGIFFAHIRLLRERGFSIALDDVGEGMTTLKRAIQIAPDFMKLDRFFSIDLASSALKQKVVRLFAEFCQGESSLILEGLEQEEDRQQASALGVVIGQGYLLGKPGLL